MKRYVCMNEYCKETGFPIDTMKRLCHSYLADKFSFRSSGSSRAPINIIVPVFESMLQAGDFKEVIEG